MIPLVVAIFCASLLGSFHCAGMCGAFLAVAIGGVGAEGRQSARQAAALQATYHLGRLISYVLLGAAAGAAGSLMNLAGALAGVRPLAAALAGGTMVVFGTAAFLRTRGVRLGHLPLPAAWTRLARRGHAAAMSMPPSARALAIGLLTTMLPCGWLYAFAVTAAGTASPVRGALVMAVFWLGTLPVLVALGTGIQRLAGAFARRLPEVTSLVLVAVGLYTLTTRTLIDPAALAHRIDQKAAAATPTVDGGVMASGTIPVPVEDGSCCNTHDHDAR